MTISTTSVAVEYVEVLAGDLSLSENQERVVIAEKIDNATIKLASHAKLTLLLLCTAPWEGMKKIEIALNGERSECVLLAAIKGDEGTYDLEMRSHHNATHTAASYYVRSVMKGSATSEVKSMISVPRCAQYTNAYVATHSLLCSPESWVRHEPGLEIQANEVRIGHASSTGHKNEEALFYLESRGLDPKESEELLQGAFLQADLEKLVDVRVRKEVKSMLVKKGMIYV